MASIHEKLFAIQQELKVGKSQYNNFGGFSYRSKEDILEAVKPILKGLNVVLLCEDQPILISDKYIYIESDVRIVDCETGESIGASGLAREPETKKGMDTSQITGTASSYAGKRALGNLFALDDTADADHYDNNDNSQIIGHCKTCNSRFYFPKGTTVQQMNQTTCCQSPNFEIE